MPEFMAEFLGYVAVVIAVLIVAGLIEISKKIKERKHDVA